MAWKIADVDLTQGIESKKEYNEKMAALQLDLLHYQRLILEVKRSVVLVFEGPDAAGKGGVIRRITEKLDPRLIRVYSVVRPTAEEYRHHYLWRFWNKLPPYGEMAIFDRSWYGRVLVERVEKFASREEWKRAYQEIREFEKILTDDGAVILKFYLHISKVEQLKRFKKRAQDPYKRWKMNDEDWRNRNKWRDYIEAAEDVFEKTGLKATPWFLVSGEHKWNARVRVMDHIIQRFHSEFGKI